LENNGIGLPSYTSHRPENSIAVLNFTDNEALGNLIYIRVDVRFQKVIGNFQDLDRHMFWSSANRIQALPGEILHFRFRLDETRTISWLIKTYMLQARPAQQQTTDLPDMIRTPP